MKINMEFYEKSEEKLSENEKKVVEFFLEDKNFDEIIENEPTVNNYIHLSQVKENLLNWYEFKKDSSLLEIGSGFGELTNLFVKKNLNIVSIESSLEKSKILEKRFKDFDNIEVIVGEFEKIDIKEKFDYIVVTDYLEENDFCKTLENAKKYLKNNGTILLAIDNKYGIKNWKGKNNYKFILDKDFKNTKKYIENNLNELGFINYKFYYIYPEYKAPNLIYTDEHKITLEDISRNFELNEDYEDLGFKENDLLENILKDENELINFFANSFLIEISNEKLNDVKYITFTNYRNINKQIQTIITTNKVIKRPVTKEAENHIKEMIENQQYFPKENCILLDKKKDDITVESDFIVGKRLDEIIEKSNNIELEFDKYKDFLYNSNKIILFSEVNKDELFEPLKELNDEILKEFNFTEYGFVDMIPKNCFVVGGMNFFFDQEWMIKFVPLEFILYRAINNTLISNEEKIKLFQKYDLNKYNELFLKLEDCFIDRIINRAILTRILIKPMVLRNKKIEWLQSEIERLDDKNRKLELIVKDRDSQLTIISNSFSWKITKPIRWISSKCRQLMCNFRRGEEN